MDLENHENKWSKKTLARNASVGCSSQIYYHGCGEGVPFKWEMRPGIPKDPRPKQDLLPPLSPPPAILSLNLPKPPIAEDPPRPSSTWSKLRFWKRNNHGAPILQKQSCISLNFAEASHACLRDSVNGLVAFAGLDCTSDSEFIAVRPSQFDLSFSSSSGSSMSSMKSGPSLVLASSESPTRGLYGKPFSCFPTHVSKILVSIARRE